ncbi:MAG: TROVE domain-containing protein, partial [Planctomycetales bacterium]|nr:TROVE domain-containing protein [Planctomycetales bacterium]
MARTNQKASAPDVRTHGGARAALHMTNEQALRRSVMSCMLWENTFYEDGESIAERIKALAAAVPAETLASIAIEARTQHNLRHVPLLLCVELARRGGSIVGDTIARVVQRADEVPELVSLYWSQNPSKGKDAAGRTVNAPLSSQMKRGLALALTRFDAYQLAKYNRDSAVKLRDVMFLVHAKPKDEAQAATWKQLVDGTLAAPDTWEVGLSSGADKRETFTRLLREKKLGYMALLRNLRNMVDANVDQDLIVDAIRARKGAERVLPFRYVSAARACPRLEPVLDE